jgi:peptide/nickel transport system permease protein
MIPGDPVAILLGVNATPEQMAQLAHELKLDRPIVTQYLDWIRGVFRGDLGKSIVFHEDINTLIKDRLPVTAYLSFLSFILSLVGIWAGIICAVRRGGIVDSIITMLSNVGLAVPVFWVGILGIYIFGLWLGWLPLQGFTWPTEDFWKSVAQTVMPVFCLAIPCFGTIARQSRSSMLETIRQDYIRTAFSKGLNERAVIFRHALKNSLIPVLTLLSLQVRLLVGGAVLTETVFGIPGMGRLLVQASFAKDYLIVQAGVLIAGIIVCLVNLLVEISYSWFDPRIRYD